MHAFNFSTPKAETGGSLEGYASLYYVESSETTRATKRDPISMHIHDSVHARVRAHTHSSDAGFVLRLNLHTLHFFHPFIYVNI